MDLATLAASVAARPAAGGVELLAERSGSVIAHLDRVAARLELPRVHAIAVGGPADLLAFLATLRDQAT